MRQKISRRWVVAGLIYCFCLSTAPFAGAQSADEYTLGPDDIIRVQVWGKPELGGRYTVDPKGDIVLPLIGEVTASGRTVGDLGAVLKERYSILFPAITEVLVSVEGYFSQKIIVLGEVRSPGPHVFVEIPSIWEVLIRAGGTTPASDLRRVEINREEAQPGEEQTLTVDLSKGAEDTPEDTIPALRPGDTIVVPSRGQVGRPDEDVQLLGAVRAPGFYSLDVAVRLSSALGASGGTLDNADLNHIRLLRRTGEGTVAYDIDFNEFIERGSPDIDINLKAGDIVTVPSRRGFSPLQVVPLLTGLTSIVSLFLALTR